MQMGKIGRNCDIAWIANDMHTTMFAQMADMLHVGIAVGNEVDLVIDNKPFQVIIETAPVVNSTKCQSCLTADIGNDAVPPHCCALVVTVECVNGAAMHGSVFYVSAFTAAAFAVPCLFHWAEPTLLQWTMLVVVAAFNVAAQSCMNRAFFAADAGFILPFDFLRLPFAVVAGFFLFSETPDVWTILGAAIIFGATYYNTVGARRHD